MDSNTKIAVVGGSVVGPATALMLKHKLGPLGVNITVYDAIGPTTSLAGGVIGLDHDSLDILSGLGIEQDEIVPFTSERVISVKVRTGDQIQTFYAGRNTTWTLLHKALRSRISPESYVNGARVVSVDTQGDRAKLVFADGRTTNCDYVIFADGRSSVGRKILDPSRKLRYAGYVANRGARPGDIASLRDFMRYEDNGHVFAAFPIVTGEGISIDWTFYLNSDHDKYQEMFGSDPTKRTFVFNHQIGENARKWMDDAARQNLTDDVWPIVTSTSTRMVAPMLDIDPPTTLHYPLGSAHALLLGDAAAPVRPHTAAGANAGIAQAATLARALGAVGHHGANAGASLDAWSARHIPAIAATLNKGSVMARSMGLGWTS